MKETKKYRLERQNDRFVKSGNEILYVEWNKDGTFMESHSEPAVGRSVLLEPGLSFAWLTTAITEILSIDESKIEFMTKNSTYTLTINTSK